MLYLVCLETCSGPRMGSETIGHIIFYGSDRPYGWSLCTFRLSPHVYARDYLLNSNIPLNGVCFDSPFHSVFPVNVYAPPDTLQRLFEH